MDLDDEIAELVARMRLRDIAMRYARAIDRRDRALLLSCYHDDAIDHHGALFQGGPVAYADWQPDVMAPFATTAHYIMNCDYRVDGDEAEGELYFIAFHREIDGDGHVWVGGRYLDRYACRAGEWRISQRSLVWDFVERRAGDAADMEMLRSLGDVGTGVDDLSFAALPLLAGRS